MTTVTSSIKNNFLFDEIGKEVRRVHKTKRVRMLYVGVSPTSYRVTETREEVNDFAIVMTSIDRRG